MKRIRIHLLFLLFITFSFNACSSSANKAESNNENNTSATPPPVKKIEKVAIFIDDVVEGLEYRNNGKVRYTNSKGEFYYIEDENTSFYIGDILIGTTNKIPEDNNLFINDLLDINRSITNNDELIKIATFLQSLDNNNSDSVIKITTDTFDKFKNNNSKQDIKDINLTKIFDEKNIAIKEKYEVLNHLQNVNTKYSFNTKEKDFLANLFKTKYLWNDKINLDNYNKFETPDKMIEDTKYSTLDRWSFVQTFDEHESFSTQQADGFGCSVYDGFIYYVQIASPCDKAGLQRGDIIFSINNQFYSDELYNKHSSNIGTTVKFSVSSQDDNNEYKEARDVFIKAQEFFYYSTWYTHFTHPSGSKPGYLRYDSFSQISTLELDYAFEYFENEKINDLIIDLRYNNGGYLHVASYLLDYLVKNKDGNVQYYTKWNNDNSQNNNYVYFDDINNSVDLNRIIFLTSEGTASASEIVINSLKPYIDVITIGDNTHGKPTGMSGENLGDKFMYFLVNFTTLNANGEGEYYDGIQADYIVDDDFSSKLGVIGEPLLDRALSYIISDYNIDSDSDGIVDENDAYPNDASCSKAQDGNGNDCYLTVIKSMNINDTLFNNKSFFFIDNVSNALVKYDINTSIYSNVKRFDTPINNYKYSDDNILYFSDNQGQLSKIDLNDTNLNIQNIIKFDKIENFALANKFLIIEEGYQLHIINKEGNILDSEDFYNSLNNSTWNNKKNKLYYDNDSNSLRYIKLDENGTILKNTYQSNYIYNTSGDMHISNDGSKILFSSTNVFKENTLTYVQKLNTKIDTGFFNKLNNLVYAFNNENDNTTFIIKDTLLNTIDEKIYNGKIIKIMEEENKYIIYTLTNKIIKNEYLFDREIYKNIFDKEKYIKSIISNIDQKNIFLNKDKNKVYFIGNNHKEIVQYDLNNSQYSLLDFTNISSLQNHSITSAQYSSIDSKIYLGYDNGQITYINTTNSIKSENHLAITSNPISALVEVGNYLFVQDDSRYPYHITLDKNGTVISNTDHGWLVRSDDFAYDSNKNRLYLFHNGSTDDDIHYEIINQDTGELDYHYNYHIDANTEDSFKSKPITISPDGTRILIEDGELYDTDESKWISKTVKPSLSSVFKNNNELVYLYDENNNTKLHRIDTQHSLLETISYNGSVVKIIKINDNEFIVITKENDNLIFNKYTPSNDSDLDGVLNTQDAFPLDVAASMDNDNDGYPDVWNSGYTQSHSTTGLTLDYYPLNIDCNLEEHGDGNTCDFVSIMPSFTPDNSQIDNNGIIYLLSKTNNRIYRYDSNTSEYIEPLGIDDNLNNMTYSKNHDRIYLGYESGEITYIDLIEDNVKQKHFVTVSNEVSAVVEVGNYLFVQDNNYYPYHITLDKNGTIITNTNGSGISRSGNFAYDSNKNRLYLFEDGSTDDDIHYEIINQNTGELDSNYNYYIDADVQSSFTSKPITLSPDGSKILIDDGDIYDTDDSKWITKTTNKALSSVFRDNNELIYAYDDANNNTIVKRIIDEQFLLETQNYNGNIVEIIKLNNNKFLIITIYNNKLEFNEYIPSN